MIFNLLTTLYFQIMIYLLLIKNKVKTNIIAPKILYLSLL